MEVYKMSLRKFDKIFFLFTSRRLFLWITPILLGMAFPVQTNSSREYQLKAAFLYNFTQFVEWPSSAFKDEESPFVIGILGRDPFGPYLDEILLGEGVKDHPLKVYRYNKVEEIDVCHILFINTNDGNYKKIFASLKNKNVLTVGDDPDFAQKGGMVQFHTEHNKIKLRINLEAVKDQNIQISSKLLRLAEIM